MHLFHNALLVYMHNSLTSIYTLYIHILTSIFVPSSQDKPLESRYGHRVVDMARESGKAVIERARHDPDNIVLYGFCNAGKNPQINPHLKYGYRK
jgi:hypothetical protein